MSSVKQFQVTFDCAEPVRVARFWAETLGYQAEYDDEQGGWAVALDPTGAGPRLYFQRVPEGKRDEPRTDAVVPVTASGRTGRAMSWLALAG